MPAQQRVRRHDGRDLPQPSATQPIRACGESAPIVIGQLEPSTPQLMAKHPIFFEEIPEEIVVLPIEPPTNEYEQQLEGGGVDHEPECISASNRGRSATDPVMGHYEVDAAGLAPEKLAAMIACRVEELRTKA